MWNLATELEVVERTRPTSIALTFLDYHFPGASAAASWEDLSEEEKGFVLGTALDLGVPISIVSVGPGQKHTFRTGIRMG
jgi:adenylosuccinate synthase